MDQSGAIAVYAAIGLVVFLGFAALALDIGHMVSVKSELQKAADAGALAGARGLWPVNLSTATSRDPNLSDAESKASATATKNPVDGANLTTAEVTVEVGRWNYVTKQFTPGNNSSANGVRVTTRRDNVQMILAQILGQVPRNMSATAISVMDFVSVVGQGSLPIAVNQDYAQNPGVTVYIGFNPDPEDNGGWFALPSDGANANTFKDYIRNDSCPPLHIGDTIDLQNGVVTSALQELAVELANHPGGWDVFLPVVDTPKFNHSDQIDAFVPIRITEIKQTGNPKYIKGQVLTMMEMASALPGGGKFGALAPPKLVN